MYSSSFGIKKSSAASVDVVEAPNDTVSCIAINADNTYFLASSWDGSVYLYKMPPAYTSYGSIQSPKLERTFSIGKPCLSVCFMGSTICAGTVDGQLIIMDMAGGQNTLQAHTAGLKTLNCFNNQWIITGSFDSTMKFWDLKSAAPVHTINLPGKVYSADLKGPILTVGMSNKSVSVYDLNNIGMPRSYTTSFNYSVRSIACSPDQEYFAVGGVEGKIDVFYKQQETKKVSFKAHRTTGKAFSSNILKYYPLNNDLLITCGSDGTVSVFDYRQRMKIGVLEYTYPITAGDITSDGKYLMVGIGDDWSKGYTTTPIKPVIKLIDIKPFVLKNN